MPKHNEERKHRGAAPGTEDNDPSVLEARARVARWQVYISFFSCVIFGVGAVIVGGLGLLYPTSKLAVSQPGAWLGFGFLLLIRGRDKAGEAVDIFTNR